MSSVHDTCSIIRLFIVDDDTEMDSTNEMNSPSDSQLVDCVEMLEQSSGMYKFNIYKLPTIILFLIHSILEFVYL